MKDNILLSRDLVFLKLHARDKETILKKISDALYKKGVVKDTFKNALIEREKVYSTGLQGENYGVAIPHTDPEHINKPSISITVLKEPIEFIHMGTEDTVVDVDIIFTLALKDADSQLDILQRLMGIIQDNNVLENIEASGSEDEIIAILEKQLYGE